MPAAIFVSVLRTLGLPLAALVTLGAFVLRRYGRRALWKAYTGVSLAVGVGIGCGALIISSHQNQSVVLSQAVIVGMISAIAITILSALLLLLPTAVLSWERPLHYLFATHIGLAIAAGWVVLLLVTPVLVGVTILLSCITGVGCI